MSSDYADDAAAPSQHEVDAYSVDMLEQIALMYEARRPALSRRIRDCARELQHPRPGQSAGGAPH